jgi:hypothetical protein
MFSAGSRGLFFLCLALICALPAWGASRSLPGNAVITVKPFSFPAVIPGNADRNLPAVFSDQIAFAVQGAGFILSSAEAGEGETAGAPPGRTGLLSAPEETPEETPDIAPLTEEAADAAGPRSGERREAAPSPASSSAPEYVLSGRVTHLREYAGPFTGITGGLRARHSAAISLTYSIADPSSGKTLFSDAVSASAARLVPENENGEAARSALMEKVMAEAAAKLAARLAGTDAATSVEDRDYYGDSPGKRLKPGK